MMLNLKGGRIAGNEINCFMEQEQESGTQHFVMGGLALPEGLGLHGSEEPLRPTTLLPPQNTPLLYNS